MSVSEAKRIKAFGKTNGLCWYCGGKAEQVDHVNPRFLGGDNDIVNLVPVCKWCNKSKRHIPLPEWRRKLELARGMAFTKTQRIYWKSIGIELPPDRKFVFYYETIQGNIL